MVDSVISPYSRTDASAQVPPTNPSIDPSARTSAVSPACALVGFCARTTVACTNGSRVRVSSAAVSVPIGHQIGGVARPCMAAHTRAGVQGMSMWTTP